MTYLERAEKVAEVFRAVTENEPVGDVYAIRVRVQQLMFDHYLKLLGAEAEAKNAEHVRR